MKYLIIPLFLFLTSCSTLTIRPAPVLSLDKDQYTHIHDSKDSLLEDFKEIIWKLTWYGEF